MAGQAFAQTLVQGKGGKKGPKRVFQIVNKHRGELRFYEEPDRTCLRSLTPNPFSA